MRVGIMAAACATAALLLASAPAAHAADFGDCPGVSGGNGRYMLKADASCDLSLLGDDAHVDLAGYTLSTTSGPSSVVHAVHVVLSGGSLRANGIYWMGGGGRMDHLDVSALGTGSPGGFFIEAGPDFTVTQSHFHDLPTSIAIDFYFSNNGSVSHSTFSHTRVGVSVQKSSGVTIQHNTFKFNANGVNLYNEDSFGVNNITVFSNSFANNSAAGIRVLDNSPYDTHPTFENTRITDNLISDNGGSGIDITLRCTSSRQSNCFTPGSSSILVEANKSAHNGYTPSVVDARISDPASIRALDRGPLAHSSAAQEGVTAGAGPSDFGANDSSSNSAYGASDDGITARAFVCATTCDIPAIDQLASIRVEKNMTSRNADRGIDAEGVTDGGKNTSRFNTNPDPCLGVVCRVAQ